MRANVAEDALCWQRERGRKEEGEVSVQLERETKPVVSASIRVPSSTTTARA